MKNGTLRIGTRGSELALWQARWAQECLEQRFPRLRVTVQVIRTTGDRILDSPLAMIGDKGLFTKEIEHALLDGAVDVAVHSLKDLPTLLPEGLTIGAVSAREDVRDVFIPHPGNTARTLAGQKPGSVVATGSLRRQAQLLHQWPSLATVDIRGNLQTRMAKLDSSSWGGMLLAAAGVRRLGFVERVGEYVDPAVILPAVGQGALAFEIRQNDSETEELIGSLHDVTTGHAVRAERALLRSLEGGCQVPIGALATGDADRLTLEAVVASLDGATLIRDSQEGNPEKPEEIGVALAARLRERGATRILDEIRRNPPVPRPS
ncbi:MAG: hydroxymethylbilane synthase [Ignavibacteria bacterium]|nr:hydroxymethylbilane synthase [Ignavibacteria bacterium]